MVLVLFDAEGYVDFEAPVQMNDNQRRKFISFTKGMFPDVEVVEGVIEKTKEWGEREPTPKKWDVNELLRLFGPEGNKRLARELDREEMGVIMKRGQFVNELTMWAKRKGYAFPPTKGMIEEFLSERGNLE